MVFLEVLCEGSSDVPAIREVLTRGLGLVDSQDFRIHPHRGKGKLPSNLFARPRAGVNTLLDLLPIKLRNYARHSVEGYETAVLVVVDADQENCIALKARLIEVLNKLDKRPNRVLFRIAVEETESWFIADVSAVARAYPSHKASIANLQKIEPDEVCGAWESLARALDLDPKREIDKIAWSSAISPHLDLHNPKSRSLKALIEGVPKLLASSPH